MQNQVYVPRQVIEGHFITSCSDCKFVKFHFAAPNTCKHDAFIESEHGSILTNNVIPDNCPRLKEPVLQESPDQVVESRKLNTIHVFINAGKGTGKTFLANNIARLFDLHNIPFTITESDGHTTDTTTVDNHKWGKALQKFKKKRDIFEEKLNAVKLSERQLVKMSTSDEPIFSKNQLEPTIENTIMVSVVGSAGVGKSTVMCLIHHDLELLQIPHTTSYLDRPFYIRRQEAVRRICALPIRVNIHILEYTPSNV